VRLTKGSTVTVLAPPEHGHVGNKHVLYVYVVRDEDKVRGWAGLPALGAMVFALADTGGTEEAAERGQDTGAGPPIERDGLDEWWEK